MAILGIQFQIWKIMSGDINQIYVVLKLANAGVMRK